MTAIPESQALAYRRLAALLPEAGLLEPCPCIQYIRDREQSWIRCLPCSDCEEAHFDHEKSPCEVFCGGTGTVVPPLEVWMGRLVRARPVGVQIYQYLDGSVWWAGDAITGEMGYDAVAPEYALLAALLQALGEKEAKP